MTIFDVQTTIWLLLSFFALYLVGYLVLSNWLKHSLWIPLLAAQVLLIVYVYIRSWINQIVGGLLPLTQFELPAIVLVVVGVSLYLNNGLLKNLKTNWKTTAVTFATIALAILWIVSHELPRLSPLSSDPNIHAFYAYQISQLKQVPIFNQGYYSDIPVGYPSFFSVQNYVWMSLSHQSALHVVHIQVLLQLLIAFGIISELVFYGKLKIRFAESSLVFVSLLLTFLLLLPYGYEPSKFHLEGTARVASISYLTAVISLVLMQLYDLKHRNFLLVCLTFIFTSCLVATNYIFWFVPLIAFLTLLVLQYRSWKGMLILLSISICSHLFFFLIDPFTINTLFKQPDYVKVATSAITTLPTIDTAIASSYFKSSIETDVIFQKPLCLLLFILVLFVFILFRTKIFSSVSLYVITALIMLFPFSLILLVFIHLYLINIVPITPYLFIPYTVFALQQTLLVLTFMLIAFIASFITRIADKDKKQLVLLGLMCVVMIYIHPTKFIQERKNNAGSLGKVTFSDLDTIVILEKEFAKFRESSECVDYQCIPKILILPRVSKMSNGELWMFPVNAATVLPLNDVFPVAFFYSMFDTSFSVDSYTSLNTQDKIVEFLRASNIQFVYVTAVEPENVIATFLATNSSFEVISKSESNALYKLQ